MRTEKANLQQLCALNVRHTVSQLWRKLRTGLQQDGISLAKLSVVGQLHRSPDLSPTELALQEGVKVQTLTRLLAELESDGWIQRTPHEKDGRQSSLSLTPNGKRHLMVAATNTDATVAKTIAAEFTDTECEQLLQACVLLDRLSIALASEKT